MNNTIQTLVVASALSMAAHSAPGQTVHIRLYHSVEIPASTLNFAMAEATRIFKSAQIELAWEQPAVEAPEDQGTNMSTPDTRRIDTRSYVVVRILRVTAASVLPDALGFSLPFARTGAHVSVFYDRVEATASSLGVAEYFVLGHAMAHELGHVLLRSSEHSSAGLMRARWNAGIWRLASAGLVSFLPQQRRRMRTGLLQTQQQIAKNGD